MQHLVVLTTSIVYWLMLHFSGKCDGLLFLGGACAASENLPPTYILMSIRLMLMRSAIIAALHLILY